MEEQEIGRPAGENRGAADGNALFTQPGARLGGSGRAGPKRPDRVELFRVRPLPRSFGCARQTGSRSLAGEIASGAGLSIRTGHASKAPKISTGSGSHRSKR